MDYLRFGDGEKNLVILPGIGLTSSTSFGAAVEALYSKLTKSYRITLIENPAALPKDYSIHDMAENAVTLMQKLGITDTCIYGVSQGGVAAQFIAEEHPELVSKLILASTASRPTLSSPQIMRGWIDLAAAGNLMELIDSFMVKLYTEEFCNQNGAAVRNMYKGISEADLKRFIVLAESVIDFNTYDALEKIQCPVLILGAENDPVFTKDAQLTLAEKTGGKLVLFPKYLHAVYDESPEFMKELCAFLM